MCINLANVHEFIQDYGTSDEVSLGKDEKLLKEIKDEFEKNQGKYLYHHKVSIEWNHPTFNLNMISWY